MSTVSNSAKAPTVVDDFLALDRIALAAEWQRLFEAPVPKSMSRVLQCRFLAFEMQARQQGGLPAGLAARLDRIARQGPAIATPGLRPGGRLLREWNGTTHVVEVTGDGFLWNGRSYRSLSAIARAITGARWSGPRFFGLTATEAAREARGRAERSAMARASRSMKDARP